MNQKRNDRCLCGDYTGRRVPRHGYHFFESCSECNCSRYAARAASFGDPVAVALLQSAGRRVGSALASVVNFFNPSLIVIGGGVANSPEQLLAAIRETIYRRSLPLATRDLRIQRSSLGGLAGVIGGSAMVVDQIFARESIARWIEAGEPSAVAEVA